MEFIKKLQLFSREHPDKPALSDCSDVNTITYGQLDELSGRVYGYLKDAGIGREDFVNILLPRGVLPFIAATGVWKAGAALVILEEQYPKERIEYIQKDCSCVLVIDQEVWREIMNHPSLPGCEEPDDHDAAFAVYTSGSTGNPKGVLHEYGNIDRIARSLEKDGHSILDDLPIGLIAPLNFVVSTEIFILVMDLGASLYIVPYHILKNPPSIVSCFVRYGIAQSFCAPSMIRLFRQIPGLRKLFVGSEPAAGIWSEDPALEIYNGYSMSEAGFIVMIARLDRKNDIAPVGKPLLDLDIILRGEDGNPVPDGQEGEICFENRYVRGYIGLPDQTTRTFVNGEYRTGDLGKRLPDGDIVVLGRIDDMIKVDGNRVEPGEIEAAVRTVTGADQVIAKGYTKGDTTYVCLYYTGGVAIDPEQTREKLREILPYYMIPSYFIPVEEMPRTSSGKIARRLLPAPVLEEYRAQYREPSGEVEKALCEGMARILKLERFGVGDDFYLLGGSSVTSMELLGETGLPGLTVSQIFRGRTPEKIAALYEAEKAPDDMLSDEEKNEIAMSRPHPLTDEQLYMFDYQLYTPYSTMLNLASFVHLETYSDAGRFAAAVNATLRSHPALLTTIYFDEDGRLMQKYSPEVFETVEVEEMPDRQLEELAETLVRPFALTDSRLYRCRIFRTESGLYLFFDVHHMIFDGTSSKVFLKEISDRCFGKRDLTASVPDFYYLMLARREEEKNSALYAQSKAYFEKRYGGISWSRRLKGEIDTRQNRYGIVEREFSADEKQLEDLCRRSGLGRNGLFITAELLALALYNDEKDVFISWVYKGRDDVSKENMMGLLFRELPVALRLTEEMKLEEIFRQVKEQIEGGLAHSSYPYVEIHASPKENDNLTLLYQEDILNAARLVDLDIEELDISYNNDASPSVLDVQVSEEEDGFYLEFDYSSSRYHEEDINRFADLLLHVFCELLAGRSPLERGDGSCVSPRG